MWMTLDGVHSDDLGVMVNSITPAVKPSRRVTEIIIPGRDGSLIIDEGTYANVLLTAVVTVAGLERKSEVMKWLDGGGKLTTNYDPDHYYVASAYPEIFAEHYTSGTWTVELAFTCKPFVYDVSPEVKAIGIGTTKIYNPGEKAFPLATWAGTLTINGSPFVATSEITYDSDAMVAYDGDGAAWDALTGTLSAFYLVPGWNTIATTAGATITPNWRYL